MKKLERTKRVTYLPVIINLDKIEAIISIFNENELKYTIQTDNYEYNDVLELIQNEKGNVIKSLKILAKGFSISFSHFEAYMYMYDDTAFNTGIFYKIDSIIRKSRRFHPFLYTGYFIFLVNICFFILLATDKKRTTLSETFYILMAACFVWLLSCVYIRFFKHSYVQLIKKGDSVSFFKAKRHDIILALISAIIGAILAVIGTLIVNKLSQP